LVVDGTHRAREEKKKERRNKGKFYTWASQELHTCSA
jgi:hypothetical protein